MPLKHLYASTPKSRLVRSSSKPPILAIIFAHFISFQVEDLPEINAILISHNHYDHMDVSTIVQLGERFPYVRWFVPEGCASFIHSTIHGLRSDQVFEASWWDSLPIGNTGVKAVFTPAQHWSARNVIFDSFSVSITCGYACLLAYKCKDFQ